jgi:predicted nucleotidyltransferase
MSLDTELGEAIRTVLRRHPQIRLALVFGSRARGVAGEASDLDLAVEAPPGESVDRLALMAELTAATGLEADVVDVSPRRRLGYPLMAALLRDAVVVHRTDAGAEAELRTRLLLHTSLDRPSFERMRDAYLDHLAGAPDG